MIKLAILNNEAKAQAIVNDAVKTTATVQDQLSNKTALCSNIIRKNAVTESAQIDFLLLVALNTSEDNSVHVAQLVALADSCEMLTSKKNKKARILDHVKKNNVKHSLNIVLADNVFSLSDDIQKTFYANVFNSLEFKQQLFDHANALYSILNFAEYDHDLAIIENQHADAILMNVAFNEATTKKAKKSAVA